MDMTSNVNDQVNIAIRGDRVGFTQTGRARETHWDGGRYWDALLFDMLHHEFDSPVLGGTFDFLNVDGE
jgi:hypothetical protein